MGRSSVTRLVKRLAHQLVGDGHVRDDDLDAFRLLDAAPHLERAAHRHEFRIALDVGDEIEHVGGGVPDAALVGIGMQRIGCITKR